MATAATRKATTYRDGTIEAPQTPLILRLQKNLVLDPNEDIESYMINWIESKSKDDEAMLVADIEGKKIWSMTLPPMRFDDFLRLEKKDEVMEYFGITPAVCTKPGVGALGIGLRYFGYPPIKTISESELSEDKRSIDSVIDYFIARDAEEKKNYGEKFVTDLEVLLTLSEANGDLEKFKKIMGYLAKKSAVHIENFAHDYFKFWYYQMAEKLKPSLENIKADSVKCLNMDWAALDDYLISRYMKIPGDENTKTEYKAHGFFVVHKDAKTGIVNLEFVDISRNGAQTRYYNKPYEDVVREIKNAKELDKKDPTRLTRNDDTRDVEGFIKEEGNVVLVNTGRHDEIKEYNSPICRQPILNLSDPREQKVDILIADNGYRENTITIIKPEKKAA